VNESVDLTLVVLLEQMEQTVLLRNGLLSKRRELAAQLEIIDQSAIRELTR